MGHPMTSGSCGVEVLGSMLSARCVQVAQADAGTDQSKTSALADAWELAGGAFILSPSVPCSMFNLNIT